MLDPRAIAVQGFGSGTLLVSVQGLLPISVPAPSTGGGGRSTYRIPPPLRVAMQRGLIEEEDLLLLLAACIDGNTFH